MSLLSLITLLRAQPEPYAKLNHTTRLLQNGHRINIAVAHDPHVHPSPTPSSRHQHQSFKSLLSSFASLIALKPS